MPDLQILATATSPAPLAYPIPGGLAILLKAATASFDGTGAGSSWQPAVTILGPSGRAIGTFTAAALAAGASADVSWFPRVAAGSSGGGGGGGGTRIVRLPVDTPDASGNGFANLTIGTGWSNVRRVLPAFTNGVDGTWEGSIQIPDDYASGGTLRLRWAANATTGNLRNRVGTSVVANNVSTDTAYTQESYVNTAVPGTALQRFTSTFALSTTLAAGSTLFVQVTRNGSSGSDTLATVANLIGADLAYTSSY